MTERKPSERWVCSWSPEASELSIPRGFYAIASHGNWEVGCWNRSVRRGYAETLAAAQLAAEDALLEIAREIREAVGRD